jgi:hypothetical protein
MDFENVVLTKKLNHIYVKGHECILSKIQNLKL